MLGGPPALTRSHHRAQRPRSEFGLTHAQKLALRLLCTGHTHQVLEHTFTKGFAECPCRPRSPPTIFIHVFF